MRYNLKPTLTKAFDEYRAELLRLDSVTAEGAKQMERLSAALHEVQNTALRRSIYDTNLCQEIVAPYAIDKAWAKLKLNSEYGPISLRGKKQNMATLVPPGVYVMAMDESHHIPAAPDLSLSQDTVEFLAKVFGMKPFMDDETFEDTLAGKIDDYLSQYQKEQVMLLSSLAINQSIAKATQKPKPLELGTTCLKSNPLPPNALPDSRSSPLVR